MKDTNNIVLLGALALGAVALFYFVGPKLTQTPPTKQDVPLLSEGPKYFDNNRPRVSYHAFDSAAHYAYGNLSYG